MAHADIDQALAAAHLRFTESNPASLRQFEEQARYMPGANSRSVLFYAPFPLTIAKGEGATLWDADGHRYADFIAEYTAGVYGHSAPEIREAVVEAMNSGINLTGHNLLEGRLARLICERFAQIEQLRFTNSGTEANLMALTAALHFTGRRKLVVFSGGYHGGVLGFGAKPLPTTVPFDFLVLPYNDEQTAREQIEKHGPEIAAILLEPMQGASGCIPGRLEFLQALRESATRVGALLIFDEVMTSRLAPHGLANKLGIRSDLTTLGKYIGGGMSFGAFGGRADVMALFDPRTGPLAHSGTFNNNVLTMAAGHAGLTKLFTPEAAGALAARGDAMRQRLNALCASEGVAMQFTGIGSLMNAHFVGGEVRSTDDLAPVDARLRQLLFFHLLSEGIYTSPRGFVVLSLPLTDADIDSYVAAIGSFIGEYRALLPGAARN
ncbi:aminotransferase class III-fold pyridoxal phosphate-dependent enzyme [Variovorax guangxiensis]|uniref:Aminotransferase class III-fold pyridoxal phosphate-dependent enzyme n=1 Tax=Variovorax guangxiensis TaxID=1775474 RepID=A0A433ME23_9BURK|nr:aminotransferase class III-fold pyridoxal phosphate-dependent enzyme [Variovorax guangxiensis]RUR66012.1 aminotransferase class III-fold pyridoxal phosphate-dependent enzyme [Variovorax guangxiensis]